MLSWPRRPSISLGREGGGEGEGRREREAEYIVG
jgi:hypothetical protein